MITASGILFQAPSGKVLFLQRGPGGDFPATWAFPGGTQEEGETLADCAIRETEEETGYKVEALPFPLMRRISDEGVDFTTYLVKAAEEFPVVLSDESSAYAWVDPKAAPQPLHPGAEAAIRRMNANELTVARMVAAGDLVSPTRFENITLYAMRMSGTGISYRSGLKEFVWRDPSVWISQDMVDRCAGVPVIYVHPPKSVLNSEEFADRVVGTVMFGYIKNDELWCTARIYDAEVIGLLEENKMSTSPAVVFRDPDANSTMKLEDGTNLLVEGVPTLLDHLAICGLREDGAGVPGVWDKGEGLNGIDQVDVKADAQPVQKKRVDYSLLAVRTAELSIKMRGLASRFRA